MTTAHHSPKMACNSLKCVVMLRPRCIGSPAQRPRDHVVSNLIKLIGTDTCQVICGDQGRFIASIDIRTATVTSITCVVLLVAHAEVFRPETWWLIVWEIGIKRRTRPLTIYPFFTCEPIRKERMASGAIAVGRWIVANTAVPASVMPSER